MSRIAPCPGAAADPDEPEDLRLDGDVERGRRLVRDDDARLAGERERDHRALAHAAGEFMRILARRAAPGRACGTSRSTSMARATRRAPPSVRCGVSDFGDLLADASSPG